jgi:cytosine deaminase
VVTLPQTNLLLQGRQASTRTPRGLTALSALRDAGVVVAGGGDNWRDPFNPLGRIDPFETAALLVAAGHMTVDDAYDAVSAAPRRVLGLPPVIVAPGFPADLLAIRAASLQDAVAGASQDRLVLRSGEVVARTSVVHEISPVLPRSGAAP